jgi:arsenate reductase
MTVILYGIPGCDTVRKARKWLEAHNVEYRFHDLRRDGMEAERVRRWAARLGWEALLNRRSATWKALAPAERSGIDDSRAIRIMLAHPAIIKRPVLETGEHLHVGFSDGTYERLFG